VSPTVCKFSQGKNRTTQAEEQKHEASCVFLEPQECWLALLRHHEGKKRIVGAKGRWAEIR
jgi:hypothetical protein